MFDSIKRKGLVLSMSLSSMLLIFVTGLLSAGHCIGMCGGIVTAVTLQSPLSARTTTLLYHIGRAFSYVIFGIALGTVGSFVEVAGRLAGMKGIASIVGGCFLLLWVWRKYQIPMLQRSVELAHRKIFNNVKYRLNSEKGYILLTGIAFGFLPCGLTYAMGIQAAATGNWLTGGLTMLIFALGTLPALIIASMISAMANKKWRNVMRVFGTWAAILIGILSILRGLSANDVIPSLHHWLW